MNIFNWLITSSADPANTSLAVKGMLTFAGGWLLHAVTLACGLGLYCVGIDATWINQAIDQIVNAVYFGASLLGAVIAIVGLIRKLYHGRWSAASTGAVV
jgi:hypothetical protein